MSERFVETKHKEVVGRSNDPIQRLKALVGYVQGIPFRFDPSLSDPQTGPITLLERETGGSCSPKHYALARLIQEESQWRTASGLPILKVRYLTYPFKFSRVMQFENSQVEFPSHIAIEKVPEAHHAALSIYPAEVGRWLLVDVTWDPPLSRVGFPVTHPWDAKSDMALTVPYSGEMLAADSIQKKLSHLKYLSTREERNPGDCESLEELQGILDAANEWFEGIRRGMG